MCIYHIVQSLWAPKEGIRYPGIAVIEVVSCHVIAGNWTQIFWKATSALNHWSLSLACHLILGDTGQGSGQMAELVECFCASVRIWVWSLEHRWESRVVVYLIPRSSEGKRVLAWFSGPAYATDSEDKERSHLTTQCGQVQWCTSLILSEAGISHFESFWGNFGL